MYNSRINNHFDERIHIVPVDEDSSLYQTRNLTNIITFRCLEQQNRQQRNDFYQKYRTECDKLYDRLTDYQRRWERPRPIYDTRLNTAIPPAIVLANRELSLNSEADDSGFESGSESDLL
ncbi:hypothetical protein ACLKA6_006087 [Drosophila palustris]